jgi:hypothetical protein
MNIWFGAKHAPFIRTPGAKKTFENATIFPPILGVKWGTGTGMEKCGKKRANFRISRPMWQIS